MEKQKILERCNALTKGNLMETLQIEFVDVGEDFLSARMPVSSRVHQLDGILHGGATVALAETVGSAAVAVLNRDAKVSTVGIEISANHLRSVSEGHVTATAKPIHMGKTIQLWEIKVVDDQQQLISHCKLSTFSRPKK
ncbi:MAG: hotdog fold thioesterase [Flavobacteriia bacterium]|jgi:1,4-dihydroxy-2-naphthoyl-CoA hydrolase|nr:hotdog fold thioesterase [Flavobacteriia bacterium]